MCETHDGIREGHMYEAAMMVYMKDTCVRLSLWCSGGARVRLPWRPGGACV